MSGGGGSFLSCQQELPMVSPLSMPRFLGRRDKKHQKIHKPKFESIIKPKIGLLFDFP
jgi:hypothetical protein